MTIFNDAVRKAELPPFNDGLNSASAGTMSALLGNPSGALTINDQPNLASATVKALRETRNFGTFSATGIKPALDSLGRIMDDVRDAAPDLLAAVGSAGMLVVRLRHPTSGPPSTLPSNHSWGTAIDITIDGNRADTSPDGLLQKGIADLIPFFNAEGWFSGVGFTKAEDDTHFEVAEETIRAWAALGFFGEAAIADPAATPLPVDASMADSLQQRAKLAFDFFVGTGWSAAQAAGLIANIEMESNIQAHGPAGDSGTAVGLCQWRGTRQTDFADFAGHKLESSTFGEQLAFVNFELREGKERFVAGRNLKVAANAQAAGAIVCHDYERPNDPDGSKARGRGARATVWLSRFA